MFIKCVIYGLNWLQDKYAPDLEAVRALLAFSQHSQVPQPKGYYSRVNLGFGEAPLTPQSSDIDSDEERENIFRRNNGPWMSQNGMRPMDYAFPKTPSPGPAVPARASVIMLAHRDGTYEPASPPPPSPSPSPTHMNLGSNMKMGSNMNMGLRMRDEPQNYWRNNGYGQYGLGTFVPPLPRPAMEPVKELPPAQNLPSRKTDGTEMTSGHRDKNIPLRGGVVVVSGDGPSSDSHIATSTRAPVFPPQPPNLLNSKYMHRSYFIIDPCMTIGPS